MIIFHRNGVQLFMTFSQTGFFLSTDLLIIQSNKKISTLPFNNITSGTIMIPIIKP